jgi:uncharacterized protein (TIGR03118 family)
VTKVSNVFISPVLKGLFIFTFLLVVSTSCRKHVPPVLPSGDEKCPGNSYINIFDTNSMLVRRFASRGALNSPWGIVQATTDFIAGGNAIPVGNFGDGRINVYALDGEYFEHLISTCEHAPEIDGLWAIGNIISGTDFKQLFFTVGLAEESHGLFG